MLSLFPALAERPVAWVAGAVETSDEPSVKWCLPMGGHHEEQPFLSGVWADLTGQQTPMLSICLTGFMLLTPSCTAAARPPAYSTERQAFPHLTCFWRGQSPSGMALADQDSMRFLEPWWSDRRN